MRRLALLLAASLLGAAGCVGSQENATRTEAFTTTAPPAGYIEEKMKARESAPKPGRPTDR